MTDSFIRSAKLIRVVDADTYEMRIDLGYRVEGRFMIRLRDVFMPELSTPEGVTAASRATLLLANAKLITVQSYKDQQSFARWIADVYVDGVNIATLLTVPVPSAPSTSDIRDGYGYIRDDV